MCACVYDGPFVGVQEEDSLWYPRERVAIAHKKLQGYDSRELML